MPLPVASEADEMVKYAGIEDVRPGKRREDVLRQAGSLVGRWTSDELWRSPERAVARIRAALNE